MGGCLDNPVLQATAKIRYAKELRKTSNWIKFDEKNIFINYLFPFYEFLPAYEALWYLDGFQ